MDAKELKEKIDLVVANYNTKSSNNTEYEVVSVMNQINDLIEENGAFYKINGAENPLIYDLFYLNSVLKWNKSQKHKISLTNTYFNEDIYKVSINQNIFNFLPKSKISNVDKVNIKSYDSSDKSFKDLVSNFSSKDELRPFMQVTNFNSLGIVSTDAHKLLFLSKKDNKLEKDENKCISDFCLKHQQKFPSSFENIRYPNWKAVIPQKEINPFDIVVDTNNLRLYLQICFNFGFFVKMKTELIIDFKFKNKGSSKYTFFHFNLGLLIECVDALLKLGIKKTKIHFGDNDRAIILTDAENIDTEFLNQNFILLMPVISDESSIFMFDFKSNSVLYADKKYEFPFEIEDGVTIEANKFEQKEVKLEISLEELSNYPKLKDKLNKLSDNKLKKEVRGGCSTNYHLTSKSYNCEYYIYISEYEVNTETKVSIMTSYHIDILKGGFVDGHNAFNQAQDKVLKYFGRIKDEPKKETPAESKSEIVKDIDISNMNFAQIVYNSNPNKFKKFKDLEWFKLKPNQTLVIILNKDEDKIVYEKIHNNLKKFTSLTDKLLKDPNIRKDLGDYTSYFYFDFDSLKKSNNIKFGSEYDYFNAKGLVEDIKDFFESKKHKEEQLLKTKFPEDKRLIKGNEYYLWVKTRGDSSNPNNFFKYKYNGLLNNVNKYAYGSENIYEFSNEHTSTHIAYEKMDNTFVNTEIYSVEDFNKWKKSYEEKNNPVTKIKETPAESKSDLEYLNELLATSNDLLDLISDTGSKENIDFLKSKIEVTENLISLLADDKFSKGGGVTYPDLSMQIPQVVNDSVVLDEFFIKKTKNTFKINDFYKKITSSDNAVKILREIWEADTINAYEQAYIMYLNKSNNLIGYYHHSTGGIDGTIMDIQMICGLAVKSLAKGVIIAHNHPSQNRQPSDADRQISQQLKTALKTFNITLVDSMIITDDSYLSFADEGFLS